MLLILLDEVTQIISPAFGPIMLLFSHFMFGLSLREELFRH